MKTYTVSLTVINNVEFLSEKDLQHELCKEIFKEAYSQYRSFFRVILPHHIETTERTRRSLSVATVHNVINSEIYYCISSKETIGIEIYAESEDKEIHAFLCRFVICVNRGLIRIGNNTTLGKGLCHIDIEKFSEDNDIPLLESTVEQGTGLQKLEVLAKTDTGILIRNRGGKANNYVVNTDGNPIIPASSWKGIFRNTIKSWLAYYGEDMSVLDQMFGNRNSGIKGCLIFYDSIIENPTVVKEKRSHIDKFTGATMAGGIKEQQYILGEFKITIECKGNISLWKKYLIRVLSDFQDRRINVGADFGIGKGLIQIENIQWIDSVRENASVVQKKIVTGVSISAKDIDGIKGAISVYRDTCSNIATRLHDTKNHLLSLKGGYNGLAASGFDDFYKQILPSVTTNLYDGENSLMISIEILLDEIERAFLTELDPALEKANKNIIIGDDQE